MKKPEQWSLFLVSIIFVLSCSLPVVSGGALECSFCEAASEIFLLDPQGIQDIAELLEYICGELPSGLQATCNTSVKALEVFLDNLPLFLKRQEQFTPYALCTMVNQCDIDCCVSNGPEQVHIAYGNDPHTSIAVLWVTRQSATAEIRYGVSPNSLTTTATGKVTTYTPGYWHGWINSVVLTNLMPGTTYYYQVGSDVTGWCPVYSFTTERSDSRTQITRIAYIGDMGTANSTNNMNSISNLVQSKKIDFILHNGDISYADGFQQRWDIFFRQFQNAVANSPYMVTLGNHEIGVIAALNLTVGYVHRFILPGANSISLDYENLFYSWNYANIHFVSLDTESVLDIAFISPKQVAWLEQDLASVDRTLYPWVIVYGHRPLYCSGTSSDCISMAADLREAIEDIVYKYQVNMVLSAHRHNYERLYPVYQGVPEKTYDKPRAPVHIINGCGGNREGFAHVSPPFLPATVTYHENWGYGMITVYNDTVLEYEFHDAASGSLLDSFVLKRA
jgi:hypothetical protein